MKIFTVLFLCALSCNAHSQQISWRVDGNFRLLKSNSEQEWVKRVALGSADLENTQLKFDDLRTKWGSVPNTYYDKLSGTYEEGYIAPKEWSIVVTLSDITNSAQCLWQLNGIPIKGSCKDFMLPVKVGAGQNKLEVVSDTGLKFDTAVKVDDVLFVGIGDSYASGEGVPDVFRRWFRYSDWWDKKCHRSLYSWQSLVGARFAAENPQKSVTFVSRACSGALIKELIDSDSQGATGEENTEVAGRSHIRPQLELLRMDLCPTKLSQGRCTEAIRQPDVVLLSIGGNDAKFATIIKDAILGDINEGIDLKTQYRKYAVEGVRYLRDEYPKLASEISSIFPRSPVVMAVYPDPLHRTPSAFCGIDKADGKEYLRLKSGGVLGIGSRLFGMRERNPEMVALYDDFITRLTGSAKPVDDDYRGILQIGDALAAEYPDRWRVVPLRQGLSNYNQAPSYQPRGYCVPGEDVTARWFLTVDDSEEIIGGKSGTLHPNIFGQLYYASKIYSSLTPLGLYTR